MSELIHTPECIADAAKVEAEILDFVTRYPLYCRTCDGWGVVGSGAVDSHDGSVDIDTCPTCSDNDICPRCSAPIAGFLDANGRTDICALCSFEFDKASGKPVPAYCACWHLPENNPSEDEILRAIHATD